MIPIAQIIEWQNVAPWADNMQVEQDLILSRIIIEIFSDPLLNKELAFRGGTALLDILSGLKTRDSSAKQLALPYDRVPASSSGLVAPSLRWLTRHALPLKYFLLHLYLRALYSYMLYSKILLELRGCFYRYSHRLSISGSYTVVIFQQIYHSTTLVYI